VAIPLFFLAKALMRQAALEDLGVALPAARLALRLLFVSAQDEAGREAAQVAAQALDHARALIRRLR
jgi:hypothetical protein